MVVDIDNLFGVAIGGILLADASPLRVGALQLQAAIGPKATHPLPELGILNTVAPVLRQGGILGGHGIAMSFLQSSPSSLTTVLTIFPVGTYIIVLLSSARTVGIFAVGTYLTLMMSSARTVRMSSLAGVESIGNISKILSQTSSSVVEGCNVAFSSSMVRCAWCGCGCGGGGLGTWWGTDDNGRRRRIASGPIIYLAGQPMGYGHDLIGFTITSQPPTPTPLEVWPRASAPPSRVRIPTSSDKPPLPPNPNPPDNPHNPVAAAVAAAASASAAKETRHQSKQW